MRVCLLCWLNLWKHVLLNIQTLPTQNVPKHFTPEKVKQYTHNHLCIYLIYSLYLTGNLTCLPDLVRHEIVWDCSFIVSFLSTKTVCSAEPVWFACPPFVSQSFISESVFMLGSCASVTCKVFSSVFRRSFLFLLYSLPSGVQTTKDHGCSCLCKTTAGCQVPPFCTLTFSPACRYDSVLVCLSKYSLCFSCFSFSWLGIRTAAGLVIILLLPAVCCDTPAWFFQQIFKVYTVLSAWPFDCTWPGLDVLYLNFYFSAKSLNPALAYWGPLSEMTTSGIPCLTTIDFSATMTLLLVVSLNYAIPENLEK